MADSKFWLTSWTVIVNLLVIVATLLNDTNVVSLFPPAWTPHVATVLAVVNLLLRVFRTNQPLHIIAPR